ncbi:hypothetical protein GCM10023205_37220 [Yinghuangia aomiensis]|uniref:Uncharacterized protein n=1 Tax=Yinghuangia aomiensis TaxID=676205 RepID=A0ABP9HE04_9ACTN
MRDVEDMGGDPVCWLSLVCPECGKIREGAQGEGPCPYCGADENADADKGADPDGARESAGEPARDE